MMTWSLIRRLFIETIETKTPLPASAACKHLFSAAGHIFTAPRARIGDTNFENELSLKLFNELKNVAVHVCERTEFCLLFCALCI